MKIKTVMGQRVASFDVDGDDWGRYWTKDHRAEFYAGSPPQHRWHVMLCANAKYEDPLQFVGRGPTLRAAENDCRRKLRAIAKRALKLAEEPRR